MHSGRMRYEPHSWTDSEPHLVDSVRLISFRAWEGRHRPVHRRHSCPIHAPAVCLSLRVIPERALPQQPLEHRDRVLGMPPGAAQTYPRVHASALQYDLTRTCAAHEKSTRVRRSRTRRDHVQSIQRACALSHRPNSQTPNLPHRGVLFPPKPQ
eukprot:1252760-Rhodomonas_salina.3